MKILDFGSCNIDYVYDVEHIVQPGETLVAEKLSKFPGGKGLNQSIAIYRGANGAVAREYIDQVLESFDAGDILLLQTEVE